MTDVTFEPAVAWDRLKLSPLNARYGRPLDVADLLTSIPAAGQLVEPLQCYREGDDVMVWDGGRRLTACEALIKSKKLPGALKAGAPALIWASAGQAQRNSLVTFVREAMAPADEFVAYHRLKTAGLALTEIAAACNVRAPRVQQLLRLVALAPEVMEAFQKGAFPLDVAEAFTLTDNHERQRALLKAFNPKKDTSWGVRQQLRKGAVEASDRWAQFVGRAAYLAAGGTVLNDLFSNREQEDFEDPQLVERLAKEKLDALKTKVEAEGWQWVEARTEFKPYDWNYSCPYDRVPGKKDTFTLEQRASAGAIIFIGHQGQPEIERGLLPKTKKAKTDAQGQPLPKLDQALYGYGHGGHQKLTEVATAAVQVAVVNHPEAAYDGVVDALAWEVFRAGDRGRYGEFAGEATIGRETYDANAMSLHVCERGYGFQKDAGVAGMDQARAKAKAWAKRLPFERLAFCEFVGALPQPQKADLLAVAFAWTLHAVELRTDGQRPQRRKHLAWLGHQAGVAINAAWTPDAEFLKRGTREALVEGLKAMGDLPLDGAAQGASVTWKSYATEKKGLLVGIVARYAAKKRWAPKLLSDLFAAPAKPKAEPKAGAQKESIQERDRRARVAAGIPAAVDAATKPAKGKPADEFGDQIKRVVAGAKADGTFPAPAGDAAPVDAPAEAPQG